MRAHRGVLGRADSGTIGAPCVLALRAPIAPARRASLRFELLESACGDGASAVVTPDEIAAVPLFADLGPVELERLSRGAADIRLVPGEYAVHAGDERALFVVLAGRLETVGVTDGIERVVGGRSVGDLFGNCPWHLA